MKTRLKVMLAVLVCLTSTSAYAGGCPEGKQGPMQQTALTETTSELVVQEHVNVDLGNEAIAAKEWKFRARSIMFGKDGVAPLHSHDARPEIVMMKHGSVTIYETNCTVPYVMNEGEVFTSGKGDSHWAVNNSGYPAIMFVVDIFSQDTFPVK